MMVLFLIGVGRAQFASRLKASDMFSYLRLQDGSTLLFGSERFFEHLDMLFAVWVLVVEGLELRLQSQQLRLLFRQLLLQLVDLSCTQNRVAWWKVAAHTCVRAWKREKLNSAMFRHFFSSVCCSLIKNAFGTDSPAFIIFYTSSLFMIYEKNSKNRTTKQGLVCAGCRLSSESERLKHLGMKFNAHWCARRSGASKFSGRAETVI